MPPTARTAPPQQPNPSTSRRPPDDWPNGSGVFSALDKGQRIELGHVVREGTRWRVWQRAVGDYLDKGLVDTQVAGIGALDEAVAARAANPALPLDEPVRRKRGA